MKIFTYEVFRHVFIHEFIRLRRHPYMDKRGEIEYRGTICNHVREVCTFEGRDMYLS